jgi:hypothetical protein
MAELYTILQKFLCNFPGIFLYSLLRISPEKLVRGKCSRKDMPVKLEQGSNGSWKPGKVLEFHKSVLGPGKVQEFSQIDQKVRENG